MRGTPDVIKWGAKAGRSGLAIRCCRTVLGTLLLGAALLISAAEAVSAGEGGVASAAAPEAAATTAPDSADAPSARAVDTTPNPPTLKETRLAMEEWTKTQQIISKERKEWQQGKEILTGRLELVKKEIATLEEKIGEAEGKVTEANKAREQLLAENAQLKSTGERLAENVTTMEGEIRELFKRLPEPIQTKLQPLSQRMPADPAKTRVSSAERFQNVLGILNEVNKANSEISVNYEVHTLADGKPSEVQAIYIGLAQAFYISAGGEAGFVRPTADGWKWAPADKAVARDVLTTLEILQGKQSPAFVGLPVKLR